MIYIMIFKRTYHCKFFMFFVVKQIFSSIHIYELLVDINELYDPRWR